MLPTYFLQRRAIPQEAFKCFLNRALGVSPNGDPLNAAELGRLQGPNLRGRNQQGQGDLGAQSFGSRLQGFGFRLSV